MEWRGTLRTVPGGYRRRSFCLYPLKGVPKEETWKKGLSEGGRGGGMRHANVLSRFLEKNSRLDFGQQTEGRDALRPKKRKLPDSGGPEEA